MRVLLISLMVVSGVAGLANASEADPSLSLGTAKVLTAWRDGTGDRLAALAEREEPDRWLVADELLIHGHPEAALAFAQASPPRDAGRLADYVRGRARRKPEPAVRDALEAAISATSPGDRLQALEALRAQRGRGDLLLQSLVQIRCADLLSSLKRTDEAAELFLGAGDTAENLGWYAMAVRGYQEAPLNSYAVDDYEATLTAGQRLLAMEQGGANQAGIARVLMFVGAASIEVGDHVAARRYLEESLATFYEIGDEDGAAWVLNNLSTVYIVTGELGLAERTLEQALTLARRVGNNYLEACVLGDLGGLYSSLGRYEEANERLEESLSLAVQSGSPDLLMVGHRGLAEMWLAKKDYERAVHESVRAMEFYELWRPRDGSAGLSAATALKRAQEHVRARKEWSHPYFWAAWVLWGLPD